MKALQFRGAGMRPEVVSVPTPEPAAGQVLLKVTAAGVCHSDLHVMSTGAARMAPFLPLTLGHEGVGVVAALGAGVMGLAVGDSVAVYGPWGCGRCLRCAQGKENYCANAAAMGIRPPGLGAPGSMAEYMVIDDARHLVPLGDLDPARSVSLTDAGLTPYHAIKSVLPRLSAAGTTAVAIGVGGLGHMGVQILRAITGATVIAVDVDQEKLKLATESGAHHAILSDAGTAGAIRDLTGGLGADAVFDFVGVQSTVDLAAAIVATEGDISIVGIGGDIVVPIRRMGWDVAIRAPYWGSRAELIEVLELARRGQIAVEIEQFSLDDAPRAYELLEHGKIRGRAVILPNS